MSKSLDDYVYNGEPLPLRIYIILSRVGVSLLSELLEHCHGKVGIDEDLHIPQINDYCHLAFQNDGHVSLMLWLPNSYAMMHIMKMTQARLVDFSVNKA